MGISYTDSIYFVTRAEARGDLEGAIKWLRMARAQTTDVAEHARVDAWVERIQERLCNGGR